LALPSAALPPLVPPPDALPLPPLPGLQDLPALPSPEEVAAKPATPSAEPEPKTQLNASEIEALDKLFNDAPSESPGLAPGATATKAEAATFDALFGEAPLGKAAPVDAPPPPEGPSGFANLADLTQLIQDSAKDKDKPDDIIS
jgi:hypothetical protein